MGLLDKKFKREKYPVPDCEGVFVRPMKDSEARAQKTLEDNDAKVWFSMGICLTDENRNPLFTRGSDETPAAFSDRVRGELDDADFDFLTMSKVCHAISKVSKYDPEELRKN